MTSDMQAVLDDPAAHDSLKSAIRAFALCDPVDAANDATYLADLMLAQAGDEGAVMRLGAAASRLALAQRFDKQIN